MIDWIGSPRTVLQRVLLFDRSPTVEILMGWLGFAALLVLLGSVFTLLFWAVGGSGVAFLILVGLSVMAVLGYGTRRSGSIARAAGWFGTPTGLLLLAFLFAFTVTIIVLVLSG